MEPRGFSRESHLCFNLALNMMLICRQRESTVQVSRVLWYIACYGNFFLHATKYVVQQKIATTGIFIQISNCITNVVFLFTFNH